MPSVPPKKITRQGKSRPLMVGPSAQNAWAVSNERLSFVRTAAPVLAVKLEAEPNNIEIDVSRTALVVIDMQNDFLHPEGWAAQRGQDIKPARKAIKPIADFLPAWRAAGGQVIWLNWGVREDLLNQSPAMIFKGQRTVDGTGYARHSTHDRGLSLVRGEWGAQVIDDLAPAPEDVTVYKHRLSGFCDNEFDSVLRGLGITTLLLAGVNTDRCVFTTLVDGGFKGYDCVLLEDACFTSSPAYVSKAVLFMVRQLHGFVSTAAALKTALPKRRQALRAVKKP